MKVHGICEAANPLNMLSLQCSYSRTTLSRIPLGPSWLSCVERCPLFRVSFIERFHCNTLHAVVAMSLTPSLPPDCLLLHTHRLKLFEFWNEDSRLPSDTLGRLSQLLAVMYSPSTEGQFLSCCMNLMLQLTWRSPDYSRPMFDVPLSECKFQVCRSFGW